MKKRGICLLLCLLLLFPCLCGCGRGGDGQQVYHLYYAANLAAARGGDAIAPVEALIPADLDTEAAARRLVEMLLSGEGSGQLHTPIPDGTALLDCKVTGGAAEVNFSAAYGQLSGMNLTIADYCVALTLIQLKDIYRVNVLVEGENLAYRDTQVFMGNDVLMTSMADVVQSMPATLYFPDSATGEVRGESRYLTWYEGENRLMVLLNALAAGPEGGGLSGIVPAGFTFTSVQAEDDVCYLSVSPQSADLLPKEFTQQLQFLRAVVRSLCSVSGVEAVQVRVEGSSKTTFGLLDISHPYTAES